MPKVILSNRADGDLDGIYTYTFHEFGHELGKAQADVYFGDLKDCLNALAQAPRMGRGATDFAPDLAPGLLRFQYKQHTIFFLCRGEDIFIVRVLHHSMDVARHL